MRKLAIAIGLVVLTVSANSAPGAAGATAASRPVVHTGAKCRSLAPYTNYDLGISYITLGRCTNLRATGGAGTMPYGFDGPVWGSNTILWNSGKSTTVDWSWALDNFPDEHESKAHSCATIPPGWTYAGTETDFTGTVTADNSGGFPVGSSVAGEFCWFLNDGALSPEPGSTLTFG